MPPPALSQRVDAMKPFHRPLAATAAAAAAAGTATLLLAGAAQAQSQPLLPELRTTFQLQGFLPRTTSTVRVDGWYPNASGTSASGEDDYGLSRSPPTLGVAFMKRIGDNWRFDLEYLEQRRDTHGLRLRRSIDTGRITLAAGTPVDTRMSLTALRIAGGRSLLRQGSTDVGVSFGGLISSYALTVQGPDVTGPDVRNSNAEPSLGLYASTALNPVVRLQGRFEVGRRNQQLNVGAQWRFAEQAHLGANLRWMNVKVIQNFGMYAFSTDTGEFRFLGPQATLEVGF